MLSCVIHGSRALKLCPGDVPFGRVNWCVEASIVGGGLSMVPLAGCVCVSFISGQRGSRTTYVYSAGCCIARPSALSALPAYETISLFAVLEPFITRRAKVHTSKRVGRWRSCCCCCCVNAGCYLLIRGKLVLDRLDVLPPDGKLVHRLAPVSSLSGPLLLRSRIRRGVRDERLEPPGLKSSQK